MQSAQRQLVTYFQCARHLRLGMRHGYGREFLKTAFIAIDEIEQTTQDHNLRERCEAVMGEYARYLETEAVCLHRHQTADIRRRIQLIATLEDYLCPGEALKPDTAECGG